MVEGPYYIPGFTNRPAPSFTLIQGFDRFDEITIAQFEDTPLSLQVNNDPMVPISSFTPVFVQVVHGQDGLGAEDDSSSSSSQAPWLMGLTPEF